MPSVNALVRPSVIAAVVLGTAALHAAGPPVVNSVPLTPDVKVDGVISDWTALTSVTSEVAVAAANDHDRLVIAIAASDQSVKQRLLAAGLILYLDPHGKKGKSYGVRIPPAEAGPGMAGRFRGGRNGPPPDAGAGSPSFDPAPEQPPVMYVEVLGPGEKESHIVDLAGQSDFEVARGDNQGTLLIEIAIPIRTSDEAPLAAPIDPAEQAIGLGLETPDVPSQGGHGQLGEGGRGGGRTGGGMGGMGGGMGRGGGMGGYPSGGGPDREGVRSGKEVKVWATLEMVPR